MTLDRGGQGGPLVFSSFSVEDFSSEAGTGDSDCFGNVEDLVWLAGLCGFGLVGGCGFGLGSSGGPGMALEESITGLSALNNI